MVEKLANIFNSELFKGVPTLGAHPLKVIDIRSKVGLVICGF